MIYLLDTGPLVAAFRQPIYRRHGREAIPLLLPD